MQGVKYNLIDPFCCCAYLSCICQFTKKKKGAKCAPNQQVEMEELMGNKFKLSAEIKTECFRFYNIFAQ